jgi:UDP-N-acetylglucosamine--N-acetylmuramyl-(pentapeptide) pyrophosphoryl-undecaprenol N-acetylglucosamine transferase
MEAELVPRHQIEIDFIQIKGLRGQSLLRLVKAPFQIIQAIIQARRHMKRFQPDVVLGMGGYVSGPGGVAAWSLGIPVVLHEQNAVAGLTNRWLSKIAKRVFQAFPGAFKQAEVVGNPVRRDVIELESPHERMKHRQGAIRILVMGGSQGARILNQTLPQAMALLDGEFEICHQAGKGQKAEVETLYAEHAISQVDVTEFIDDVAAAYQWADLVVCRSGALTVSEISSAGVAAIFVPFMHKDRQQALNAEHLIQHSAARMIEQPDLSPRKMADEINALNREQLMQMAIKARDLAMNDADEIVANAIITLTE